MKFYLELTPDLLNELLELYTFISCDIVYNSETTIVVKCETDYLACAKIDQQYFNRSNIYHASEKFPDPTNITIDKTNDCVTISKGDIVAKATINDGNVDLAEEKCLLLYQSMLETKEFLKNEFQE